jgi:septal ring factor EnvC (AmiA/AmiB activator)
MLALAILVAVFVAGVAAIMGLGEVSPSLTIVAAATAVLVLSAALLNHRTANKNSATVEAQRETAAINREIADSQRVTAALNRETAYTQRETAVINSQTAETQRQTALARSPASASRDVPAASLNSGVIGVIGPVHVGTEAEAAAADS